MVTDASVCTFFALSKQPSRVRAQKQPNCRIQARIQSGEALLFLLLSDSPAFLVLPKGSDDIVENTTGPYVEHTLN